MNVTMAANEINPGCEKAGGMEDFLTKHLEQNVREIEEERKLLRALVQNSTSVGVPEKTTAPTTKKQRLPISNNISQISYNTSPSRSCHFTKSYM